MRAVISVAAIAAAVSGPAVAQAPCGGAFGSFVADLKQEELARGQDAAVAESFFRGVGLAASSAPSRRFGVLRGPARSPVSGAAPRCAR